MSITNEQLEQIVLYPHNVYSEPHKLATELLAARTRIEELEAKNEAKTQLLAEQQIELSQVNPENARLRAKVAELEADREMVEWIEAQAPNMFCLCEFDDNERRTGWYWEVNDNFQGKTFRTAVNAARAASANQQNDAGKEGK